MNHREIIDLHGERVEQAVVVLFKQLTPTKLLRGKFLRSTVATSEDNFIFITYTNATNKEDKTNISLIVPLNELYPFTIEIGNEDDAMGFHFEGSDFSKKNIHKEVKVAYNDFLSYLTEEQND